SHPRMALLRTALEGSALRVHAPGATPLELPLTSPDDAGAAEEIPVWGLLRPARSCGPRAAEWASDVLGVACRVVRIARAEGDALDRLGRVRESFADAYPALVVSRASLADLNARLARALPMDRFRPNLVLEGVPPYAEDAWGRAWIGPPERGVRVVGRTRCFRCVITTTDQETGERGVEPLRTLATYRRAPDGEVAFGMNVGFEGDGTLAAGDPVTIEAHGA